MTNVAEQSLVKQGVLPPTDFSNDIDRIVEIANINLQVPPQIYDRLKASCADLFLEDEILRSVGPALSAGNLLLQGPPGTGKTTLALAICKAMNVDACTVTAHEDWSTFDVIGRHELRSVEGAEEVVPVNGFFTDAVVKCAGSVVRHADDPAVAQAAWLVIDEFNRAPIDRAFGELFTVLGTDELVPVNLPHQREGNKQMTIPRAFRIVGTLNSIDRQFVNALSLGIRRRFTFLTVDVPAGVRHQGSREYALDPREVEISIKKAGMRVAGRQSQSGEEQEQLLTRLANLFRSPELSGLRDLLKMIASVRYATIDNETPHVPIGTAVLVDLFDIFMTRVLADDTPGPGLNHVLDWAASLKLPALFDVETVLPMQLEALANQAPKTFALLRRELRLVISAGRYYVDVSED